ncbi:tyrosine-type recombinase/integrase [Devosia sp. SL43]|uniref:tyrosine-type recombinase/integrase n=1 Tax=Devosia sp. SL43 TaxID=2806348 RepID=UPI001F00957F|nr:tyrosine-type recombinase/integrase [Devosia sp. SL43]UJW87937.1 tyrosine-type recombinase/integrase [Devosia sp. SL43]
MLVRIVGVKTYTDRHGKRRRYYRRKGCPTVTMDPTLDGNALAAEVARLDALYKPYAARAGTLILLIQAYKAKSAHWAGLRERTQADYDRVFDYLRPVYDQRLVDFTAPVIASMRDTAREQRGFKFANQMLVTLKMLFAFGVEYGHMTINPAADISTVARPTDLPEANRPWSPEEAIELMRAPIYLAAPIAMSAYLGLREGDVLKMAKTAIDDQQRLLSLTTSKTRRSLELPVCDDLRAILIAFQKWRAAFWDEQQRKKPKLVMQDRATTMFVNSRGQPWTSDGFRTSWGKWRDSLVEGKKVAPGCTFHGGRHTVATILAECGFEALQVKHLLGHGSETMTEHYQRRAKRRGMLKDMTDAVQMAYRVGGGNVVVLGRAGNGSDYPSDNRG